MYVCMYACMHAFQNRGREAQPSLATLLEGKKLRFETYNWRIKQLSRFCLSVRLWSWYSESSTRLVQAFITLISLQYRYLSSSIWSPAATVGGVSTCADMTGWTHIATVLHVGGKRHPNVAFSLHRRGLNWAEFVESEEPYLGDHYSPKIERSDQIKCPKS